MNLKGVLNLRLRPALQAELPAIHLWTVSEPWFWDIPAEAMSLQRFMDLEMRWFMIVDEKDEIYGAINLGPMDWVNRSAGAGVIIPAGQRRNGIGSQCTDLVKDLAFKKLGLHKLWASVLDVNEVTWKGLERMGWKCKGVMEDAQWLDGAWHDRRYYELKGEP